MLTTHSLPLSAGSSHEGTQRKAKSPITRLATLHPISKPST